MTQPQPRLQQERKAALKALRQKAKQESDQLPLYCAAGLAAVEKGTAVVFQPTSIDMSAGVIYGTLPEFGGASQISACIPHGHLTRKWREAAKFLTEVRRTMKPFTAEIVDLEVSTAQGVEHMALDEDEDLSTMLSKQCYLVTLDRRRITDDDHEATHHRWQHGRRAAAIVDAAITALNDGNRNGDEGERLSVRAGRQLWLYPLHGALDGSLAEPTTFPFKTNAALAAELAAEEQGVCGEDAEAQVDAEAEASAGQRPRPGGVHKGITCDRSDQCPIIGPRYHLEGQDYDLCQEEFDKCSEAEQVMYVRIDRPGMTGLKITREIILATAKAAGKAAENGSEKAEEEVEETGEAGEEHRNENDMGEEQKLTPLDFFLEFARIGSSAFAHGDPNGDGPAKAPAEGQGDPWKQSKTKDAAVVDARCAADCVGSEALTAAVKSALDLRPDFAAALLVECVSYFKRDLKPSTLRLPIRLFHNQAAALEAAAQAAVAVPVPTGASQVELTMVSPPVYSLASITTKRYEAATKQYLKEAAEAAQKCLASFGDTVGDLASASADYKSSSSSLSTTSKTTTTHGNIHSKAADAAPDSPDIEAGKVDAQDLEQQVAEEKKQEDEEELSDMDEVPVQDNAGGNFDQPTLNIGLVGHVAHGKSSLCRSLTGKRTQQHSMELKLHGASVKLGYANCKVMRCTGSCVAPDCFTTMGGDNPDTPLSLCPSCGGPTRVVRHVSFVDCPGHHDLIATMLTGASAFDAAILLVAANEEVPAPQTASHLAILTQLGFGPERICVLQNKAELVLGGKHGDVNQGAEKLRQHGDQCRRFLKGSAAEGAPLIAISAHLGYNVDAVAEWMARLAPRCSLRGTPTPAIPPPLSPPAPTPAPTPAPSSGKVSKATPEPVPAYFNIVRSYNTNKAGTNIVDEGVIGGVVGGTLMEGRLVLGDVVEIRPGHIIRPGAAAKEGSKKSKGGRKKEKGGASATSATSGEGEGTGITCVPILTTVQDLKTGNARLDQAFPGGLIGVSTGLDPALARSDGLTGMVLGTPGTLPPVWHRLCLDVNWLDAQDLGDSESDDSDGGSDSDAEDGANKAGVESGGHTSKLRNNKASKKTQKLRKAWLSKGNRLRLHVGAACTLATVLRSSKARDKVEVELDQVVVASLQERIAFEVRGDGAQGDGDGKNSSASSVQPAHAGALAKKFAAAAEKQQQGAGSQSRKKKSGSDRNYGEAKGDGWHLAGFGILQAGAQCKVQGSSLEARPEASLEQAQEPATGEEKRKEGSEAVHGLGGEEEDDLWRSRFLEHVVDQSSELLARQRIKIPPVIMVRDGGARAVWTNFGAICAGLQREPSHVASFFRREGGLGDVSLAGDVGAGVVKDSTQAKNQTAKSKSTPEARTDKAVVSRVQLRIHTRARNLKDKVNRLLRRYCMAFVTCKQCHSARTVLTRGDDRNIQNRSSTTMELCCLDCHARSFVRRL